MIFVWLFTRNFHLKSTLLYRITNHAHYEEISEEFQNLLNLEIKKKV